MIFLMVNVATCKVNMTYIDPKGNWIVMKFVPLQEFFPGTLRRPTLFFFMEGSASGILLEDARLSKLMVVQSLVYSDFITKVGFGHNFTTLTCATPNCPRTVRYSHRTHTDGVSGEMKGHRDGDRTTSLSGFV